MTRTTPQASCWSWVTGQPAIGVFYGGGLTCVSSECRTTRFLATPELVTSESVSGTCQKSTVLLLPHFIIEALFFKSSAISYDAKKFAPKSTGPTSCEQTKKFSSKVSVPNVNCSKTYFVILLERVPSVVNKMAASNS